MNVQYASAIMKVGAALGACPKASVRGWPTLIARAIGASSYLALGDVARELKLECVGLTDDARRPYIELDAALRALMRFL